MSRNKPGRFAEQMERAMQAVNQMQDEHRYTAHALRDALAENKRLRHMLYSNEPKNRRWQDRMDGGREGRGKPIDPSLGTDSHPVYGKPSTAIAIRGLPLAMNDEERAADQLLRDMMNGTKPLLFFDIGTWLWCASIGVRLVK